MFLEMKNWPTPVHLWIWAFVTQSHMGTQVLPTVDKFQKKVLESKVTIATPVTTTAKIQMQNSWDIRSCQPRVQADQIKVWECLLITG